MASSACTSVTFEGAPTPYLRNVLENSRRQYVPAVHLPTNRTVLYWVTPKAAHTRIVRLLRRPPFATMPTKATDAYYGSSVIDFGAMMHPGAECIATSPPIGGACPPPRCARTSRKGRRRGAGCRGRSAGRREGSLRSERF